MNTPSDPRPSPPADTASRPGPERSAPELEAAVQSRLGRPVELTLTDNVRSMVSFRPAARGGVVLRVHRMFRRAPAPVLDALADWIDQPRQRPEAIKVFMRQHRDEVRPPQARRVTLTPAGRQHDLAAIFADLNARYFDSQLEMRITWGRRSHKRYPRTMRLGSYCADTGVISISPRLDRQSVPRYFVAFVVYHEMLHQALGISEDDRGRRRAHTREFRRLERLFHDYERAAAFEERFCG